jgi:Flp pilus assembly protein TadD
MKLGWLNGREAAEIGAALADEFALPPNSGAARVSPQSSGSGSMERLLRRADSDVRPLQLNFFKKAKFANSFKWRLIENGISKATADEVTERLVVHLSHNEIIAPEQVPQHAPNIPTDRKRARDLFNRGNKFFERGAYSEAAALFEEALTLDSVHAETLNNFGTSLAHLGRYEEAEQYLRQSMALKPNYSDPYGNLGNLLLLKGDLVGAEAMLRRALKLRPTFTEARVDLGLTLTYLGRVQDAKACFTKVLKSESRNVQALHGVGQVHALEGRFDEAEATFRQIIEVNPRMPAAWASLATTRKMTGTDSEWFKSAESLANSGLHPMEEANLRFALGKYCDDISDFAEAFQNFKRGNELLKTAAPDYDQKDRASLVDRLIRGYSAQAFSNIGPAISSSEKPVFVLGMPRSGTSLAEQIIASHPETYGAGELTYWESLVQRETDATQGILTERARLKVAAEYLRILESRSGQALRVTDKAPVNSDFLGIIYSVFPNARVIYMQRDPVDTCLSCYFQKFSAGLNFTLDSSHLAHYFGEHRRLMAHWRAVLPPGFILDVPYEGLVADQETWSRRMLDFIGLEWDPRVLEFHTNTRRVATASAWQVRQKVYKSSVARGRNYERFIGPLKSLRK